MLSTHLQFGMAALKLTGSPLKIKKWLHTQTETDHNTLSVNNFEQNWENSAAYALNGSELKEFFLANDIKPPINLGPFLGLNLLDILPWHPFKRTNKARFEKLATKLGPNAYTEIAKFVENHPKLEEKHFG